MRKSDILMVSSLIGAKEAGFYQIATQLTFVLMLGLNSVTLILAPKISKFFAQDESKKLQNIISKGSIFIFLFSCGVSFILIFWGKFVLSIFGAEYIVVYNTLVILTLGRLVKSIGGTTDIILTMTEYQYLASKIMVVTLIANIALNFALIPIFNIEGAALATAITTAVSNTVFIFFIRKKMGLKTTVFNVNTLQVISRFLKT